MKRRNYYGHAFAVTKLSLSKPQLYSLRTAFNLTNCFNQFPVP